MNRQAENKLRWAAALVAFSPLLTVSARADAWGASWGRLDATVNPTGAGDTVLWNSDAPGDWLLHAEADLRHMHPPLSVAYDSDSELWDPTGDGQVALDTVATGDLARVLRVIARVASTGGPYVDINLPQDVYSSAHDISNSSSDAAALGQHDNLLWIQYGGGAGPPPPTTTVRFLLEGPWSLAGDSAPDDNWWADWFGYGEVYDPATGNLLGSDSEYHALVGPGAQGDGGSATIEFSAQLAYDTPYAFRFFLDLENHAQAVPEPTAGLLLVVGLLALARRR